MSSRGIDSAPGHSTLNVQRQTSGNMIAIICSLFFIILATVTFVPTGIIRDGGGASPLNGTMHIAMVSFGIIIALNNPISRNRNIHGHTLIIMIVSGFVIWAMLTTLWSPLPLLTGEKSLELGLFMAAAVIVARLLSDRNSIVNPLAISLILAVCFLIVVNVPIWGTPFPFTSDDDAGNSYSLIAVGFRCRFRLTLAWMHPMTVGDTLAMTIICTILSSLSTARKVIFCSLAMFGIWLADARTALYMVLLTLILIGIKLAKPIIRFLIVSITLLSLVVLAVAFVCGHFDQIISDTMSDDDIITLDGRTDLWSYVVSLTQNHWCFGGGFHASRHFLMNQSVWGAAHVHNLPLEIALETGIIGIALYALFVCYVVHMIWRTKDELLFGLAFYGMVSSSMNPDTTLLIFVLMVVLIATSINSTAEEKIAQTKENVRAQFRGSR